MFKSFVSLVSLFFCCYSVNGESVEDHIAKERIKIACKVQIAPLTTQLFDECIKENGMPYNLRQIFSPCAELAGLDFNSYDGIYNFTCKEMGKNRLEVIGCVVKNIGSASPDMNIVELSHKAYEIAKICSRLVAKALADEALAKVKALADEALAKGGLGKLNIPKLG